MDQIGNHPLPEKRHLGRNAQHLRASVPSLNPYSIRHLIGHRAIFVDVRDIDQWLECHVEGTIHIPFENFKEAQFHNFPNTDPVVVFSQSGNLSTKAVALLQEWGMTNSFSLEGGLEAWKEHIRTRITKVA